MVDILTLSLRRGFDLPLDARMRTGRGDDGARSGKGASGVLVVGVGDEDVVDCGDTGGVC